MKVVKGLATVGVVAAVGYGIARHTTMGRNAVEVLRNLQLPDTFSFEDIKGAVKSAMKAANSRTKTFRQAAKMPYKITKDYTKKLADAPPVSPVRDPFPRLAPASENSRRSMGTGLITRHSI